MPRAHAVVSALRNRHEVEEHSTYYGMQRRSLSGTRLGEIVRLYAGIAQLVEHSTDTRKVLGSNPSARTKIEQIGFAKLFSGDFDFRKTETNFVFVFCPRGGGVWGGIRAG